MRALELTILLFVLAALSCVNPVKRKNQHQQTQTLLNLGTLTLEVPPGWGRIKDDTLPKLLDMTMRYMLYTPEKDTVFIWHGNSAWSFEEDDSTYMKVVDTLGGFKAFRIRPKPGYQGYLQYYIDSVGSFEPTGKYGLSMYVRQHSPGLEETFWQVTRTVNVRPF